VNIRLGHAAGFAKRPMADHQSGASGGVQTVFESTLESVDTAENLALEIAEKSGFQEEDLHKIGMAVREAMVNAVVHGNRYNLRKKVHYSVNCVDERLSVTIVDEGEGFEAAELPDPLSEENLLRQSGRGLLLIKAFVDEFAMRKAPPLGTEVRMVFHRNEAS
jgi:serine/threonine-protein kinase RsbW